MFAAWAPVCPDSIYRDLRRLAKRMCRRSNSHHLEDDVVQAGALGLVEASIRFDPHRSVPFGAYAKRRIEGAMLDEIRFHMPLSRRAYERDDGRIHFDGESTDEILDTSAPVDELLARGHDLFDLRRALKTLAEDEHAIIIAVYDFDETGRSGTAHARSEGLSRSHASRHHRRAISRLREALGLEVTHG
jgi:RNA polymerase sigma factor (sigma-70 family)